MPCRSIKCLRKTGKLCIRELRSLLSSTVWYKCGLSLLKVFEKCACLHKSALAEATTSKKNNFFFTLSRKCFLISSKTGYSWSSSSPCHKTESMFLTGWRTNVPCRSKMEIEMMMAQFTTWRKWFSQRTVLNLCSTLFPGVEQKIICVWSN